MTFRDDHDAALARADALDVELKRAKAERDALGDELANVKAKAKVSSREQEPEPTRSPLFRRQIVSGRWMAIAMTIAAAVMAALFIPVYLKGQRRHDKRAAWEAATLKRSKHVEHWQRLISVEPCVRDVALDTMTAVVHRRPEVFDPRKNRDPGGWDLQRIQENCGYRVRELVNDPSWPATVRDPIRAWMNAETELTNVAKPLDEYMSHKDWKDDDFKGGREMWTKLLAIVARRDAAIAQVRRDVLPVLRAEIKQLQAQHLAMHGGTKDEIWWRLELGLAKWEIDELALDAGGVYAGKEFDDAAAAAKLHAPVAALLARLPDANLEVRRQMRDIDWVTKPLAEGRVPGGETPLWHLVSVDLIAKLTDRKYVPAMPPDPGPPLHNHDDY